MLSRRQVRIAACLLALAIVTVVVSPVADLLPMVRPTRSSGRPVMVTWVLSGAAPAFDLSAALSRAVCTLMLNVPLGRIDTPIKFDCVLRC